MPKRHSHKASPSAWNKYVQSRGQNPNYATAFPVSGWRHGEDAYGIGGCGNDGAHLVDAICACGSLRRVCTLKNTSRRVSWTDTQEE